VIKGLKRPSKALQRKENFSKSQQLLKEANNLKFFLEKIVGEDKG
jgi:hypothetical protein